MCYNKSMTKEKANQIYGILLGDNPSPKSELNFKSHLHCLIAVMLSAQCTDARVNIATKGLFAKFKTAQDFASASEQEIAQEIKSVNYYPTKAKRIKEMCTILQEKFNGQVPGTIEELTTLPGVGRKTAQVVLVESFGVPAVPVDTHIFRVCNRLGVCRAKNVEETESAIREYFDEKSFINLHKLLVLHGRYVCRAKNPDCENCKLKDICEKRI